jgi:hypothetical protein
VRRIAGMALIVVAAALAPAGAVSTRTFSTSTYKEFDEGTPDHALITSIGEVMPGATSKRVDLETEAIWAAARGPDGTVYAGGVSDGTIYAVPPGGGATKRLAVLDKETPWIGALTLSPDGGTLYAGTLGSAAIHAIDVRSGKVTRLVKLEGASHIWSLALDPTNRILWAGTGPSGKLYAIEVPAGKPRVAWESGDKHLLSMIRAQDGTLWIGTSDEAILFRFDPKAGTARAIADFAGTEIKAIAEVPGGVVVATNEFEQKTSGTPAPAPRKGPKGTVAKAPEAGSAPGADKPAAGEDGPPRSEARKGKGALFRVEPDGRTEQLHALAEGYFTSLAVAADGDVYAGSGALGRVYQVRRDRSIVTAFDVSERQVNAVMAGREGLAFATGDSAAVYFADGRAKDARYTSKVLDAQFASRWGNLRWRGTGVSMETRSGNTAKPDKGWSSWDKVASPARTIGDATVGRVTSPPGRYLQYRASFAAEGAAVLRDVNAYYLPQNQRARVTDLTVTEADPKKGPVTLEKGSTKPRSPVLKLKWKVENPDEDELVYKLELRPEGETEWRDVHTGVDPLTAANFDWNTEALPDGWYRMRIVVSDRRANPRDAALEDAYVSPPFLVDNSRPQVAALEVKYPLVTGKATDAFSRISEIAYQLDSGEWIPTFPQDGIFDDMVEPFSIRLPADLKPGVHTLAIRVADEADNIGASSVQFRVGK